MISSLITKYLNGEASEEEIAIVFEWIELSKENKNQFIALKKAWSMTFTGFKTDKNAWGQIQKKISPKKTFNYFTIFKYAAVLIVAIGMGIALSPNNKSEETISKDVVLELDNGQINYIKEQEKNILDYQGNIIAEQHANEIVYRPNTVNNNPVYHTLKIPYGKTFKVTLSDGSVVHLNAGTTFKYPEQFKADGNRNVFLSGEAFFEVAKDEQHPFIVSSNQVAIEVLGTKFNLSSYDDDFSTHCVLVEGSVRLSENANTSNNIILTPNHISTWDNNTRLFNTEAVDVKLYTAWVYGELVFKNELFGSIAKKLERSYGVKIINNNIVLATQRFTGTIKIKESEIENILELFKIDTPFEYSKEDHIIEISNTNLKA